MADFYGWYGAATDPSRLKWLADDSVIFQEQAIALHATAGLYQHRSRGDDGGMGRVTRTGGTVVYASTESHRQERTT